MRKNRKKAGTDVTRANSGRTQPSPIDCQQHALSAGVERAVIQGSAVLQHERNACRPASLLHAVQAILAGLVVLVTANTLAADDHNWPNWRGPFLNGSASPHAQPPLTWSEGCAGSWKLDLPGEGSATPVVWNGRIFVLSAEQTDRKAERVPETHPDAKTNPPEHYYRFLVTAVDSHSGQLIWQKSVTEQVPHEGRHPTHTYAAGSPVTDGQRLYVSFGSRGIFCLSLDGDLLWQRDLGDMRTRYGWGEAVTPALSGDRLIINWDAEEGSFVTALDTRTGDELWRRSRPTEPTSWNTPLVVQSADRTLAVVNGTGRARAYDVSSGEVVWECGGQTTNAIPTPLAYQDLVVCMSGYRGSAAIGIPLDSVGDLTGSNQIRWKHSRGTPYVASPTAAGQHLFFTAGRSGFLTVLDLKTGATISERMRLDGIEDCYASPLAAAGHVFICSRNGTTVVIRDRPPFETVARNQLTGKLDASPVAVGSQLFLRSWSTLYGFSSAEQ